MKLKMLFTALLAGSAATLPLHAQISFGPGAGTGSSNTNCLFGTDAGRFSNTSAALYNVAMGHQALRDNGSGDYNTAIGGFALYKNTGSLNTAVGGVALYHNTSGASNTAIGHSALTNNTIGFHNTAVGVNSMTFNTTGYYNVAVGSQALSGNTSGYENTAVGQQALGANTLGYRNVALGRYALSNNVSGHGNTAGGYLALTDNTTGDYNTALGKQALSKNTLGSYNISMGYRSLFENPTGIYNSSLGASASRDLSSGSYNTTTGGFAAGQLTSGSQNTSAGYHSMYLVSTGSNNVSIGSFSGGNTSGTYNNAIAIGQNARFNASNQARIGNSAVTSIGGNAFWTNVSDARFKSDVKEDVMGLAFINALRPVSYQLDRQAIAEFDGVTKEQQGDETIPATYHTGFLAQEVEKTAEALGFKHFDGVDAPANDKGRYGLRYAAFVVPLVKSVQELDAKAKTQAQTIQTLVDQNEGLQQKIEQQQAQIDALLKLAQQQTTSNDALPQTSAAILYQNNPNPFSESTTIRMSLPTEANSAYLMVTNLEGRQLFQQAITERGETTIEISAQELPAGLYLYTLVVDEQLVDSKKMLLTK